MAIIRSFVYVIQQIAEQASQYDEWLTSNIVEINGVQITPLTIMLPSILVVILAYLIIRFLLV